MELANKKVLVVGLGATGVSTARFAKSRGADVTVTDTAGIDVSFGGSSEINTNPVFIESSNPCLACSIHFDSG